MKLTEQQRQQKCDDTKRCKELIRDWLERHPGAAAEHTYQAARELQSIFLT